MSAQTAFPCPRCAYEIDAAAELSGKAVSPRVGDLTVCLHCAAPLEFAADAPPRWLTYQEVARLELHEQRLLLRAILAVVTQRPALTGRATWRLRPATEARPC